MKKINCRAICAVVIGLFVSFAAVAQERVPRPSVADKYVISARAGGVNHTEGTVTIIRASGKSGALLKGDQVEIGDRVSTAADGRAEVLLNPGSYIRIAGNSSFEFGTTDLEDLQIRLESGSAMFEVFAANEFRVTVFTPKGKVSLIETGVYRIDVSTDGSGRLAVSEGKAEVGETNPVLVKSGRTATIGTDTVAVAKFDRGKRDELAEWSRTRARDLTRITSSLRDRDLSASLLNSFNRGSWGMYGSFGLWVFSPMYGHFCFLPFGAGWYSPYGYGYGTGIYWYNLPRHIMRPVSPVNPVTPVTPPKHSKREPRNIQEPPPFTKVGRGRDDARMPTRDVEFPTEKYSPRTSMPTNFPAPSTTSSPPTSSPKERRRDIPN